MGLLLISFSYYFCAFFPGFSPPFLFAVQFFLVFTEFSFYFFSFFLLLFIHEIKTMMKMIAREYACETDIRKPGLNGFADTMMMTRTK